jgi:uncharacterized membrane protein required for colicin V production
MIDLVAFSVLALLVVRGWARGFVRQAIDVVALVLGAALAFRLAVPVGSLITATLGWSPEMARIVGGAALFLALSIGAGLVGSMIHRSLRHLPGTNLLNRAAGATLGAVYAAVIAVVVLSLAAALPLPSAVAAELESSKLVRRVVDPEGPAQRAVGAVAGDRAMQSMIWLRRVADDWLLEGSGDDIALPQTDDRAFRPSVEAAARVAAAIDDARIQAGEPPLAWSPQLGVVAVARAGSIYRSGSLDAAAPVPDVEERVMLVATIEAAARAIDGHGGFSSAGIGVVDGPYGLLVVMLVGA